MRLLDNDPTFLGNRNSHEFRYRSASRSCNRNVAGYNGDPYLAAYSLWRLRFLRVLGALFCMAVLVHARDRPDLPPFRMPERFRHDIAYFMNVDAGSGPAAPGDYRIDLQQAREWLEDGVFHLVSPLDSEHRTEVELTEEQEAWLEWLLANEVTSVVLV